MYKSLFFALYICMCAFVCVEECVYLGVCVCVYVCVHSEGCVCVFRCVCVFVFRYGAQV